MPAKNKLPLPPATPLEELAALEPLQKWKNGKHLFLFNRFGFVYYERRFKFFHRASLRLVEVRQFGRKQSFVSVRDMMTSYLCARIHSPAIDWKGVSGVIA